MANRLKIRLNIADRVYPMTIAPSQEEGLRKAAKKIEAVIKQFEKNYAVRDKQDVLAMCALQFAAKSEQQNIDDQQDLALAEENLTSLNAFLDDHL
ncbi:MAG TPA: cell division protein ZapA [Balneolaceae bacterium]|nr:cell division protein ZapA [Balneolaceae bacterium]